MLFSNAQRKFFYSNKKISGIILLEFFLSLAIIGFLMIFVLSTINSIHKTYQNNEEKIKMGIIASSILEVLSQSNQSLIFLSEIYQGQPQWVQIVSNTETNYYIFYNRSTLPIFYSLDKNTNMSDNLEYTYIANLHVLPIMPHLIQIEIRVKRKNNPLSNYHLVQYFNSFE